MKIGRHYIELKWGDIKIAKHKSFEYQFEFGKKARNNLEAKWFEIETYKQENDHQGFGIMGSLLKSFWFDFNVHDHRHWYYENNCLKEF